jgi:hypothetical protein
MASDPLNLEIALGAHKAVKAIPAGADWQEIVLKPGDFKNPKGAALEDFSTVEMLTIDEARGPASLSVPKFRNLRWIVP